MFVFCYSPSSSEETFEKERRKHLKSACIYVQWVIILKNTRKLTQAKLKTNAETLLEIENGGFAPFNRKHDITRKNIAKEPYLTNNQTTSHTTTTTYCLLISDHDAAAPPAAAASLSASFQLSSTHSATRFSYSRLFSW